VIDLELYVELVDFFLALEYNDEWQGGGEAAFKWFADRLDRDDLDYVLLGVARLSGHPKGEDWEQRPRRPELDQQLWTFHRVWVDRYGSEPTMRLGKDRKDYWDERARGGGR
jgi:hypothetical protein